MSTLRREDAPRREDYGDGSGFCLRYVVHNDDTGTIGTYGVHHNRHGEPFGGSRDYHYLVGDDVIAKRRAWVEAGGWDADDNPHPYVPEPQNCEYAGGMAHCDGSSLVEIHAHDEDRWREAEMMAR